MPKFHAGLTLIEVMIGVVLMAFLMALGIPSMLTYFQNNKIRGVADEMQAGLQRTKAEAIKRDLLVNFVMSGTGWSIIIPSSSTTLLTRPTLSGESAISVTSTATTVGFNGQGRTNPTNTYSIQLTPVSGTCQSAGGSIRCLTLTISASGSVKMCDPALASTDPRAC